MTWKTSFFVILLAVGTYGLVHSLLASLPAKAWARRTFGPEADRSYRLIYNIFAGITLLPLPALVAALPGEGLYRLPAPWSWLALGGQGLALLLLVLGVLQTGVWSFLGLRQVVRPPEAGKPELAVTGLYRYVRHPLYTAGLIFIWLSPVMTSNLLAFYLGLTVYIVIGALHEEYRLRRVFGEAYRAYMRSTPMLIPYRWRARPDQPRPS